MHALECVCVWRDNILYIYTVCVYQVEVDYSEGEHSISNYPLSAALTCAKLCNAAEDVWGIV